MNREKILHTLQADTVDEPIEEQIGAYANYLKKIIFGILKDPTDSEEAYLEITQKIMLAASSRRGENFKAWIARIAVNHCIDRKKRSREDAICVPLENLEHERPDSADPLAASILSPRELLLAKESLAELQEIIAGLPEIYQAVIRLYYGSGLSMKEIAQELELNPRTVETRIFRARKMISEQWRNHAH